MISIDFFNPRIDGGIPTERHELLLRVVAVFLISQDGRELFTEVEFPVVELAYQLWRWQHSRDSARNSFSYESMESEDRLLWFSPDSDGWTIGSGNTPIAFHLDMAQIQNASERFIERVLSEIPKKLGVSVKEVVTGGA